MGNLVGIVISKFTTVIGKESITGFFHFTFQKSERYICPAVQGVGSKPCRRCSPVQKCSRSEFHPDQSRRLDL
jgi:hypothetical protein